MGNLTGNANGGYSSAAAPGVAVGADSAFVAGGTQQIAGTGTGLSYTALVYNAAATQDEQQTLTFSTVDSSGNTQTAKVLLDGDAGAANLTAAGAVNLINAALQATDVPALQGIVASTDGAGGNIYFSSGGGNPFSVSIGQGFASGVGTTNDGLAGANTIVTSKVVGVGNTASVATQTGSEAAVTALSNAVTALGNAQAVVGRGENQFTYATNLAQSQLTNLSAAESDIRDANMATEAANLTKAQILMQAGVAALAQANSAPQVILSLLKS